MNSTVVEAVDGELEDEAQLDANHTEQPMDDESEIRITKDQFSVFEFLRHEQRGRVILAAEFQRNVVWTDGQCAELVESILMGIPIPLIYLFEDREGVRQVVDGKQRITALKRFIHNEFKLQSLKVMPQLNTKLFKQLSPFEQGKIEDYQLNTYIIQPPTPERIKFNIFDRVNRAGTPLNKQEMRFALYQGKATELLKTIAESDAFVAATGGAINSKRMRDHYLILRFWAFMRFGSPKGNKQLEYNSDIDDFLANTMVAVNDLNDEKFDKLKTKTLKGLANIASCLAGDGFRFDSEGNRRPINAGLFEVLVFIGRKLKNVENPAVKSRLIEFRHELDELGICGQSLNSRASYQQRLQLAREQIEVLNAI